MSQRGYGDPPYPPTDSGARKRPETGSSRDLSGGYDRESEPIWTDSLTSGSPDYGRQTREGRRGDPDEPRYEPPPSRQTRSRWSNPPPRRRRNNRAGSYAPPDVAPGYRSDNDLGYDETYPSDAGAKGWDEYGQQTQWNEGQAAPATGTGRKPTRQFRPPRMQLSNASRTRRPRPLRPASVSVRLPNAFTRVEIFHDQPSIALFGMTILSAVLMAGILASRIGNLPDVITLRYDASGSATRWGTPEALWELPLLAGMISVINIVLAWRLSSIDRFASRFVLGTAVLVSVLAWVSLVRFLW